MEELQEIKYLKEEKIGKVLIKGLTATYKEKPKFPVDFLAKWLLNYDKLQKNEIQALREIKLIEEKEEIRKKEKSTLGLEKNAILEEKKADDIEKIIESHYYHEELIHSIFPNFLEKKLKLSGVYIGKLDFPLKEFNELENDEEDAHIDLEADKLIIFFGVSDSHKFMLNKTSSLDQGITPDVFKEPENNGYIYFKKK